MGLSRGAWQGGTMVTGDTDGLGLVICEGKMME
jgi:hypothetical protein